MPEYPLGKVGNCLWAPRLSVVHETVTKQFVVTVTRVVVETKSFKTKTETAKFVEDEDQFFLTFVSRPALVKTKTETGIKCRNIETAKF